MGTLFISDFNMTTQDNSTALIDYYRAIGLGPVMDRCNMHTHINEFHTIYGGGYSAAAEAASYRLYKRILKGNICEIITWKKRSQL